MLQQAHVGLAGFADQPTDPGELQLDIELENHVHALPASFGVVKQHIETKPAAKRGNCAFPTSSSSAAAPPSLSPWLFQADNPALGGFAVWAGASKNLAPHHDLLNLGAGDLHLQLRSRVKD